MSSTDPILGPPVNVGSIVSFRQRGVQPPGVFYVTVLDQIQINLVTSLATVTVTLVIKLLLTTGEITQRVEQITLTGGTRAQVTNTFQLAEGFLLGVTVAAPSSVTRGALYASGSIVRTASATTFNVIQPLFQGYIQTNTPIGWPLSAWENAFSGYGAAGNQAIANPAAGADWSVVVPTGAIWEVKSLTYQLVTAAAAANRQSRIIIDGNVAGIVFYQTDAIGNQVASLTNTYTFAQGGQRAALVNDTWANSLPSGFRVRAGGRIRTQTAGLQAADQYQNINVFVEEWLSF